MASQFADLYEKVDGTNSFSVLLDIAQGRTPRFTRRQGRFEFAASCVLRSFHDSSWSPCRARPISSASPASIRISGLSYMPRPVASCPMNSRMERAIATAVLNLGGRDLADVLEQFESCRAQLGIELLPIEASQDARADLPRESMVPAHNASGGERPPSAA